VVDPELFKVADEILERRSFPADRLVLEITEDSLTGNEETVAAQFVQLRKRGIRIAIDKFGVGHLGINGLKRFPADQLKLDRSLVVPVSSNETDRRIASAVIELAHAVDLEIVADGVEDADIMRTLVAMGCEIGEGFHFSRPIPAADFTSAWVAKFARSRAISA
jgi:EAL domain-containing protein (putative c-di-GMP-specific phosphodiesterase class I)